MQIADSTVVMPGITARLNSTGFVAVDLGYEADPIAFTPEVITSEKARLPDWMFQKEYERNFHAQTGKSVFRSESLKWQQPYLAQPLYWLAWDQVTKVLTRTDDPESGLVKVWIHPDSQSPHKPAHIERIVRNFGLGIDVGEGVGRSDSAIVGIVGDTREQAMEFRSNRISPAELGQLAAALGRYFNEALILCVRKMHGLTTIREMADSEGYALLWHERILTKAVRVQTENLGWRGAEASDENLFGPYRKAIDEHLFIIHSSELVHQLGQYLFDDMGRIVHQKMVNEPVQVRQRHGDIAVAGGLAWRAACDISLFKAEVLVDEAPYGSLNWRDEEIKKRKQRTNLQEQARWE